MASARSEAIPRALKAGGLAQSQLDWIGSTGFRRPVAGGDAKPRSRSGQVNPLGGARCARPSAGRHRGDSHRHRDERDAARTKLKYGTVRCASAPAWSAAGIFGRSTAQLPGRWRPGCDIEISAPKRMLCRRSAAVVVTGHAVARLCRAHGPASRITLMRPPSRPSAPACSAARHSGHWCRHRCPIRCRRAPPSGLHTQLGAWGRSGLIDSRCGAGLRPPRAGAGRLQARSQAVP